MDIKSLQAYLAVAEKFHFGAAAEQLHLSQPSLSARIKRLEDELGFALFERSSAGVSLTKEGQLFRGDAESLIESWKDLKNSAQNLKLGRIKTLRIGITDIGLFSCVTAIISQWNQKNPEVKVELFVGVSNEVEQMTDLARIDIGFFHPPAEYSNLSTSYLFETENVVVLPEHHTLAGKKSLNLGDLANESFILVKRSVGPCVYDRTIAGCMRYGFSPDIRYEVDNSITLIGHVAIGLGVGLTIAPLAIMALPGVKYVPLKPSGALPFGLCWRQGFFDIIADEFISIAQEVTGDE